MAKKDVKVVEEVKEAVKVEEKVEEVTESNTNTKQKVYKFVSIENPTLYVGELGIWFKDGKLEVTDSAIADFIGKIYGVKRVGD